MAALRAIPSCFIQFEAAFGPNFVTTDNVGRAIATFERAIVTEPSPYDFYKAFKRFADLDDDDLADLKEDAPEIYAE